MGMVNCTGTWT